MKDRQPKHRQAARERAKLGRQVASRAGLPTALIVCEGRCTEPFYLGGLIEHLGVNAANAHIQTGSYKTDALSLVRDARARFRSTPEYDHVFVVLDGDQAHLTDYEKGDREIFAKVSGGLAMAEANAARGIRDITATGATSPRTDMPVLIAALRGMSRRTEP